MPRPERSSSDWNLHILRMECRSSTCCRVFSVSVVGAVSGHPCCYRAGNVGKEPFQSMSCPAAWHRTSPRSDGLHAPSCSAGQPCCSQQQCRRVKPCLSFGHPAMTVTPERTGCDGRSLRVGPHMAHAERRPSTNGIRINSALEAWSEDLMLFRDAGCV